MTNQLRCLLLNADGRIDPGPNYPGEAYVPPDFRPHVLTGPLQRIWGLLFGTGVSRALLNWRLHELLTCVHGTGMGNFATALDPRITYLPFNSDLFRRRVPGAVATLLTTPVQPIYFQTVPGAGRETDKIFFKWTIEIVGPTTVRVSRDPSEGGSAATVDVACTFTNGLSSLIPLDGSQLGVTVGQGIGGTWSIELLTAPAVDLVDVLSSVEAGLDSEAMSALFGGPAPYTTFKSVWETHDQLPYRAAALTLALGYRINELPPA